MFAQNILLVGGGSGGGTSLDLTPRSGLATTTDASSHTLSSCPIGDANDNRWVVVFAFSNGSTNNMGAGAITIDGTAATYLVNRGSGFNRFDGVYGYSKVTGGTSIDIVVDTGSDSRGMVIQAYTFNSEQVNPAAVSSIGVTITPASGDCAIFGFCSGSSGAVFTDTADITTDQLTDVYTNSSGHIGHILSCDGGEYNYTPNPGGGGFAVGAVSFEF